MGCALGWLPAGVRGEVGLTHKSEARAALAGGVELEAWAPVVLFMATMAFTPGPNTLVIGAHTAQHGVRASIPFVGGFYVTFTLHAALIAVTAIWLTEVDWLLQGIVWVGAAYICWLAWRIGSAPPLAADAEVVSVPFGPRQAVTVHLLNGKAWLYFVILFTALADELEVGVGGRILLVVLNSLIGLGAAATWMTLGSQLRRLYTSPTAARVLNVSFGAMLALVAVWMVLG